MEKEKRINEIIEKFASNEYLEDVELNNELIKLSESTNYDRNFKRD